jgi:hypothetical protein
MFALEELFDDAGELGDKKYGEGFEKRYRC